MDNKEPGELNHDNNELNHDNLIVESELKKRLIIKKLIGPQLPLMNADLKTLQFSKREILDRKRKRIDEQEEKRNAVIKEELNKFITEINNWDTAPENEIYKCYRIDVSTTAKDRIILNFLDDLDKKGFYYTVEFNPLNFYIKVFLYAPILATFKHNGILTLTNAHSLSKAVNNRSRYC